MTIFIDLVGAWLIRISMIAIMLGMTVTMNDALYQSAQQARVKGNVVSISETMTHDISLAGLHVTGNAFTTADSINMRFSSDLDATGGLETVYYQAQFDATAKLYKLYRTVDNGNSLLLGDNFERVMFRYYDAGGAPTTTLADIAVTRVQLVANIPGITQVFTSSGFTTALVDFKVFPLNL
jgi:hypothetical protein